MSRTIRSIHDALSEEDLSGLIEYCGFEKKGPFFEPGQLVSIENSGFGIVLMGPIFVPSYRTWSGTGKSLCEPIDFTDSSQWMNDGYTAYLVHTIPGYKDTLITPTSMKPYELSETNKYIFFDMAGHEANRILGLLKLAGMKNVRIEGNDA